MEVSTSVRVGNVPNVGHTHVSSSWWLMQSCNQAGLDYFKQQLKRPHWQPSNVLYSLVSPQQSTPCNLMQPQQFLLAIQFLSTPSILASLKAELPDYIAWVADTSADSPVLGWWRQNGSALHT